MKKNIVLTFLLLSLSHFSLRPRFDTSDNLILNGSILSGAVVGGILSYKLCKKMTDSALEVDSYVPTLFYYRKYKNDPTNDGEVITIIKKPVPFIPLCYALTLAISPYPWTFGTIASSSIGYLTGFLILSKKSKLSWITCYLAYEYDLSLSKNKTFLRLAEAGSLPELKRALEEKYSEYLSSQELINRLIELDKWYKDILGKNNKKKKDGWYEESEEIDSSREKIQNSDQNLVELYGMIKVAYLNQSYTDHRSNTAANFKAFLADMFPENSTSQNS